ncbi:hypothetical protein [Sulfolobus islandicus rod-shaped virus 4]|uniref:Uncharacterized protein n=1 Tax=Sulfolobus islandicus rod-shaped virus 4 TaxID=1983547 RepID=A0A1X9SJZ6_9VIRU|nr:hypothetical protein CCL46_gp45 [Sulfolobus islandicus rod-shaped virus 4]ARQ96561.1 hypothetical protein [Sulfolobus islandicus rod-shaped virus 4]
MTEQIESIILRELDLDKFSENISESLREDNISESCYTNFKDSLVETIGQTISTILEKDGWKIKRSDGLTMFNEKDSEKLFNAFMKNSEFTVTLKKKIDNQKYEFKQVIIKFDFPEEEKKRIAEEYITSVLLGLYYLDICIFVELEKINVDKISETLSNEVYGLLRPEEIKTKFKDAIETVINILEYDIDDDSDIADDDEEE